MDVEKEEEELTKARAEPDIITNIGVREKY